MSEREVRGMVRRRQRGQSIGEYAILFAVVLGAVVAMQRYVSNRLATTIKGQADAYQTSAGSTAVIDLQTGSRSESKQDSEMASAEKGKLKAEGTSESVSESLK